MVYAKLGKFLSQYPKKEKHTHTIYGGDIKTGAYTIPFEKTDEFHKLIAKAIHVKGDRISVVEKVQDITRFVIDLDLKWTEEITERQYNEKVLMDIVNDIMSNLNSVYELSDEQKFCMVMEKEKFLPAKHKDYKSKDGIHLLFPYIIAEKKTYRTLRDILIKTDYKQFFLDEGFIPPSNTMEEIVDENIYKGGNWFIYGSGKPNEITYQLTRIYKKSADTLSRIPLDLYIDDKETLVKMNSVKMQDDINVVYTENLKAKMSEGNLKKSMSVENVSEPLNQVVIDRAKTHDIEISKKLALILSVERSSSYAEWLEVGYCLNSISQCLLPAWIAFSKKWSMFNNSDECEKQWEWFNRNNNHNYTIGSLHYWAKNDNPSEYKDIIRDSLSSLVHSSVGSSGSHADVANVIFHYFKDCFVCANIKDNTWFHFNENKGGKWEETEMGHELRSRLSYDIVDVFKEFKLIHKNKPSIKIPNILKRKIKSSVVFQSDDFIIINKWAGIPCQRGSKINLSIDDLLQFFNTKDSHPKLVHRLDKDTTGLLIIAKNSNSARYFHKILSNHKIKKTYYAIVEKKPKNREGILNDMLPKNKKNVSAETKYQIIKKLPGEYFLLKLNPQSGRKHQIRQHCFMNGFPILGDKKYYIERNQIKFSNLFLHAGALEFIDMNNKKVKIETELPNHFRKYL